MTIDSKILVIYKKSALQLAKERKNKQILDLIEKNDPSVCNYVDADRAHYATLDILKANLPKHAKVVDFRFRANAAKVHLYDLVITVGGDGTFMWASKLVGSEVPMLGINSAPDNSVGFYTSVNGGAKFTELFDFMKNLDNHIFGSEKVLNRLKLSVNGKVVQDRILNDVLFAAKHPAGMTSYILKAPTERRGAGATEPQRSSGIWISAPGGSTAANLSAGGWILPLDDRRMQYVVREPMKNYVWGHEHRITHGFFEKDQELVIINKTRQAILACDGTTITIPVTTGDRISITHSDEPLTILGK